MDWLLRPLFIFGILTCVFAKDKESCPFEKCSNTYSQSMDDKGIYDPEPTKVYCDIVKVYKACLEKLDKSCRGYLNYHGTLRGIQMVHDQHCTTKSNSGNRNNNRGKAKPPLPSTSRPMLPSCRYYGTYRFRHCGFYGDPHLKTFNGMYQTCRVEGNWTLIDNPYMSVQVISAPVSEGSQATAPVKISIVVKGHNTPCTLEKRYEADSRYSLPPTFTDGSDRSGPDETVTLEIDSSAEEDRESIEIVMRYIASRLMIRRKGKYLAFNAKLPDEVVQIKSYDEDKVELCSTGCPATEQLNPILARGHVIEREEALRLCTSMENLTIDDANTLTDNYLDWCVFDVMTAGRDKDFIDAAHAAQSDALKLDEKSLKNRTTLLDLPYNSIYFTGGGATSVKSSLSLQLPFYVLGFVLTCTRFLTSL